MTNAEQIALYWKQVEAIEEERTAVDAKLEEQADAIRAKIRALEPPPTEKERLLWRCAAENFANNNIFLRALNTTGDAKIGTTLRINRPNYTVRTPHG